MEFVTGDDVDPVYFDSPYFVYPDGPTAVEVLRVIGAAIAKVGVVGLGRLTLSRRERMVMAEPRGTGMALCAGTLRVGAKNGKKEANQKAPDRRQPALLLPLTGARKRNQRPSADPAVISALSQTDGTGHRSSLAKIASADLVQTKGLGLALCSAR